MSENKLYEAAARGDERSVGEILEKDHLLLDRVSYACSNKNPLHVATAKRHLALVQIILRHNPDLAQESDSQQTSALHVASSKGYREIARELLSAAPDMCLSRDRQGRNPLHLAAMKGHVGVLEELVTVHPMAAYMKLDGGMTVLHLCVVYHQMETLTMLVRNFKEMVNAKDNNGETILHIAVRCRQIETVNFLLSMTPLEVKVHELNLNGMTAVAILDRSKGDARDSEIKESFNRAIEANDDVAHKQNNFNHHYEWHDRKREALMVVASVIATMAFQVGVNPPGGVWQDDKIAASTDNTDDYHEAGLSILAQKHPGEYTLIYVINTIGFVASLSIILLLMSGLPLRKRFFVWFLMVITWVAITAIAFVYERSLMVLNPDSPLWPVSYIWIGLMTLLLMANTARLTVKLVQSLRERRRRGTARWFQCLEPEQIFCCSY